MKIKQVFFSLTLFLGFSYASQAGHFENFFLDGLVDEDTTTSFVTVPNAFQPNGTLMVNEFKPAYKNITAYTMSIYNRWGGLVFESTHPDVGWNGKSKGKDCPIGAYIYVISYTPILNGVKAESRTIRGSVSLLE